MSYNLDVHIFRSPYRGRLAQLPGGTSSGRFVVNVIVYILYAFVISLVVYMLIFIKDAKSVS